MKKELIALVFSDLHMHIWKTMNENMRRTEWHEEFFMRIYQEACTKNVPLLFSGDLIHDGANVSMELLNRLMKLVSGINHFGKQDIIAIPGNHDQDSSNRLGHKANNIIAALSAVCPRLKNIDYTINTRGYRIREDIRVWGVPYFRYNDGLQETIEKIRSEMNVDGIINILLMHTIFPGAKDTNGHPMKEEGKGIVEWDKLFDGFDLVLCGHVHQPFNFGGGIFNVGSPLHQRLTDVGSKLGHWEIWLTSEGLSMKFIKNETSPQFKTYKGNTIPDDYHFWIKEGEEVLEEDNSEPTPSKAYKDIVDEYFSSLKLKGLAKKDKLINIIGRAKND